MQFHRSAPKNITHHTGNPSMLFGDSNEPMSVCQLCQKQEHTIDTCWHRCGMVICL